MSVVDVLHHAVFENCVMAHSPRWSARGFCAGGGSRPCCAVVVAAERFHGVRRLKSNWPAPKMIFLENLRSVELSWIAAAQRRAGTGSPSLSDDDSITTVEDGSKKPKRAPRRSRKKASLDVTVESNMPDVNSDSEVGDDSTVVATIPKSGKALNRGRKKAIDVSEIPGNTEAGDENAVAATTDDSNESPRRGRRKASASNSTESNNEKKTIRRGRSRRKMDNLVDHSVSEVESDNEELKVAERAENVLDKLNLSKFEAEDISFTYSWPPLVCCFGAAQLAFVPSGRPANRLIDHDIHQSKKDMLWSPDKFVRAPGGPSSDVAIALAKIGGRVAFMGKLGDDDFGQTMLYHLNINNVQTRSVKIDKSKATSLSYMKIAKRGSLKGAPIKPCAEDCLVSSDINIDVLKEARMFYFNSSSLLDTSMRSTTFRAIEIAKKFGGSIFFDLNLPLPLWESGDITKDFIRKACTMSDFIEVTKQELEFLCGIQPTEKFDTKVNDKSKFVHYKPEFVKPLWHDNLKVLFVTNGTSKIHFYTEKEHGFVRGAEDAPITPFTCDMSASGDAIVAALMRMITVQPQLATEKGYLRRMVKFASDCGVTDQWISGRVHGFPPKEGPNPDGIRSITERQFRTVVPVGQ